MRKCALCDREDPMLTRSCSLPYVTPHWRGPFPCDVIRILRYTNTVLRRVRRWSLQDQEHSERRQERQALGGPVGQTEYVNRQEHQKHTEGHPGE